MMAAASFVIPNLPWTETGSWPSSTLSSFSMEVMMVCLPSIVFLSPASSSGGSVVVGVVVVDIGSSVVEVVVGRGVLVGKGGRVVGGPTNMASTTAWAAPACSASPRSTLPSMDLNWSALMLSKSAS